MTAPGTTVRLKRRHARGTSLPRHTEARLLGIGTAVPALSLPQSFAESRLAELLNLCGAARGRWRRIIAGSGIEKRHAVAPMEAVLRMSTAARMSLYEAHAPGLGEATARRALEVAGIEPPMVTDLIVVSCTGFSAPGLDTDLVRRLGLGPTTRRTLIGYMGCFGGIVGLRQAAAIAQASSPHIRPAGAVVLVVCVELCSLHLRDDAGGDNLVASALFADGAAAAVVASSTSPHAGDGGLGAMSPGSSLLIDEGREWMSWRITDAGFAMTLAKQVPDALRRCLASFVRDAAASDGAAPRAFAVHPGGPGILDAVDHALALHGQRGLPAARQVLRNFGNMSSGTVLWVLEEALKRRCARPIMLLAFGPGLSVEAITLSA